MQVDVIMLSDTKNAEFHSVTREALETLRESEESVAFDVHLVETNRKLHRKGFAYPGVDVIIPGERFRYNRFLNHGLAHCRHDWIVISNNDVTFTKGWFSTLMAVHRRDPEILSLSPWDPGWHPRKGMVADREYIIGHRGAREVAGWCLAMHASLVERCGLFDERFEFWYQDDDYGMTLRTHGIKHALVPGSVVHHKTSASSENFSWWKNWRMKNLQFIRYLRKWNQIPPK